jgi:ADP-ribosylglycohydrolase/fructose-1,6-bisphosphatase/inositol monophosphatase family enzyme
MFLNASADEPNQRMSAILALAIEAVQAAGDLLRRELHRPDGPRGEGDKSPADDEAEAIIRDRLDAALAEHGVLGEELTDRNRPPKSDEGFCWLIDPNDGTSSFVKRGRRGTAVSLGLLRGGEPVLGVVYAYAYPDDAGDLIAWAEGLPLTRNGRVVRRESAAEGLNPGATVVVSAAADWKARANAELIAPARFLTMPSIAYRLALVAVGEADATISIHNPTSWDFGAGHALLKGAGLELVDAHGEPIVYRPSGEADCYGRCFAGRRPMCQALANLNWSSIHQAESEPESGYDALVRPERGRLASNAGQLSRAQGCLLGQLAGDSLGSLVEFKPASAIQGRYPQGVRQLEDGGVWNTLAGQPTDDSELALILARTLAADGCFNRRRVAAGYAHWYASGPFDLGGTTRQALSGAQSAAMSGEDPWTQANGAANLNSKANGALMRVSPLGVFGHAIDPTQLAEHARDDAAATHPNEVCQDASVLFTLSIALAVAEGAPPRMVYERALNLCEPLGIHPDVRQALQDAQHGPPADYQHLMGYVLIAFRNAFYQLLHAQNTEDGVIDTVMRGGDTDTNAAIAGALLGAVHGRASVPNRWRRRIVCCRPIRGLAEVHQPRPRAFWPVDAEALAERLLVVGGGR